MSLHRLTPVTMGVPNVEDTMAHYTDFGLTPVGDGTFRTEDGGDQLRVEFAPMRLIELGVGADDPDDIAAVAAHLGKFSLDRERGGHVLRVTEPIAGFVARIEVASRVAQDPQPPTPYNGPGRIERYGRAPRIMRCSVDHHDVLALAAPVNFPPHQFASQRYRRHRPRRRENAGGQSRASRVGLGWHHAGSNFFWYLAASPELRPTRWCTGWARDGRGAGAGGGHR